MKELSLEHLLVNFINFIAVVSRQTRKLDFITAKHWDFIDDAKKMMIREPKKSHTGDVMCIQIPNRNSLIKMSAKMKRNFSSENVAEKENGFVNYGKRKSERIIGCIDFFALRVIERVKTSFFSSMEMLISAFCRQSIFFFN